MNSPVIVVPGITASDLHDAYQLPPEAVWTAIRTHHYERVALHPDDQRYELHEPARVVPGGPFPMIYENLVEELRDRPFGGPGRDRGRLPLRIRLAPAARPDRGAPGHVHPGGRRANPAHGSLPAQRLGAEPDRQPGRPFHGRPDHRRLHRTLRRRIRRQGRHARVALPGFLRSRPEGRHRHGRPGRQLGWREGTAHGPHDPGTVPPASELRRSAQRGRRAGGRHLQSRRVAAQRGPGPSRNRWRGGVSRARSCLRTCSPRRRRTVRGWPA